MQLSDPIAAMPVTKQRKVEPGSVDVNENVGSVRRDGLSGCAVIAVSGGVASVVHAIDCALPSTFPAGSTAWMRTDRSASLRPW